MTSPIQHFRYLTGVVSNVQRRLLSSSGHQQNRRPVTPERIAELRKLAESSFRKSEEELAKNYDKLVCRALENDYPAFALDPIPPTPSSNQDKLETSTESTAQKAKELGRNLPSPTE